MQRIGSNNNSNIGKYLRIKNVSQIHQWATNDRVSKFLKEKFGINHVPCYYWLLCLLKMIKTESLNRCFANWVYSVMPEKAEALTISLDGKTICSTTGMESYSRPLHIISAQISELELVHINRNARILKRIFCRTRRKFADVLYVLQEFSTQLCEKYVKRRALSVNVNTL